MNEVRLVAADEGESCSAQFEAIAADAVSGGMAAALLGAHGDHVGEFVVLRVRDSYLRDSRGDLSLPIFQNVCSMFFGDAPCRYVGMAMIWTRPDDKQYALMQSTMMETTAYMQHFHGPGDLGPRFQVCPGSGAWDFYEPVYQRLRLMG